MLNKKVGWALGWLGVAWGIAGTWALLAWRAEIVQWAGIEHLLAQDAIPIPLRFGWAVAVLLPAGGLMHLGRFVWKGRQASGSLEARG